MYFSQWYLWHRACSTFKCLAVLSSILVDWWLFIIHLVSFAAFSFLCHHLLMTITYTDSMCSDNDVNTSLITNEFYFISLSFILYLHQGSDISWYQFINVYLTQFKKVFNIAHFIRVGYLLLWSGFSIIFLLILCNIISRRLRFL